MFMHIFVTCLCLEQQRREWHFFLNFTGKPFEVRAFAQ